MKKKILIIAYLFVCSTIVATAILAGKTRHKNCRECKLAMGHSATESNKFAGK